MTDSSSLIRATDALGADERAELIRLRQFVQQITEIGERFFVGDLEARIVVSGDEGDVPLNVES